MDQAGRDRAATGALAPLVLLATVIGGALAVLFAVVHRHHWLPAVGVPYTVGGLGLAAAWVFPVGSGLHAVAALFFFTAWLPPVVPGLMDWRAGLRARGTAAVGLVAVGIWLPYDLGLSWAMVGYSAAELVSFVAWGAWSAWTGRRPLDVPNAAVTHREGPA